MSIEKELEERIRSRGVRIDERWKLAKALLEDPERGGVELRRRLAEAERRIRNAARELRDKLR